MNRNGTRRKRWKMQRALGLELPGLGRPGALDKRNYPPGQHGATLKRRKRAGFALQLMEKQKLLFHYGLREEQLRRFVRQAQRGSVSDWMEVLLGMLELRVDNLVFRLGWARSMAAARQLVSHGHVLVNGRRETIGSRVLRQGARLTLTERARELATLQPPRLPLPSYLELAGGETDAVGTVVAVPGSAHVPFEFSKSLVAEYYATRGV